jgi:NAD(P)H-hydrate epimerase
MSLDIPSGINADTGEAELAVTADLTATLAAPKAGMFLRQGPEQCGRLRVLDIGIPADIIDAQPAWQAEDGLSPEGFSFAEATALLSREPFTTYKNQRGHLLVVGGSREYSGAPLLTATAALRASAGLVTLALPESCQPLGSLPCGVMVRRFSTVQELLLLAEGKSALALGPGLGTSDAAAEAVAALLALELPTVLDADGLNLLAAYPRWLEKQHPQLLLTPHPGEGKRLSQAFLNGNEPLGTNWTSRDLARATGAVVLLKGCRSQVAAPDGQLSLNLSGAPSLATAGSGDVLTGICGALLANGLTPFDAARLGCFLHGLTGELATPCGSRGVIADDLPALLPDAFRLISPRL